MKRRWNEGKVNLTKSGWGIYFAGVERRKGRVCYVGTGMPGGGRRKNVERQRSALILSQERVEKTRSGGKTKLRQRVARIDSKKLGVWKENYSKQGNNQTDSENKWGEKKKKG